MPGHTGGHSGKKGVGGQSPGPKGQKGGPAGGSKGSSSKGSTKGGKKEGKSFSDRLREKQKQNQAQREQLQRNLDKIKSGTAVKAGKGFLRDERGDIVSYSGGATKAREDAKKRAAELAQKELEQQGITASLDMARRMMEAERQTLLDRAKQNQITGGGLARLGNLNQIFGANPTTGMGLGESLRFQGQGLAQDIPGLARAASFIANPASAIASAALTGGEGILGLLDKLRTNEDEAQDIATGKFESGQIQPSLFERLRIGEGAPFVEERGGRQDERGLAALRPPMQTGPSLMTQPIQNLPITTQPVTGQILNQYLALAGFSPQEIQGMPSAFRFLG